MCSSTSTHKQTQPILTLAKTYQITAIVSTT